MINGQEKREEQYSFKKWHVTVSAVILTVTLFLYAAIVSLANGISSKMEENQRIGTVYRMCAASIGLINETTGILSGYVSYFVNNPDHNPDDLKEY